MIEKVLFCVFFLLYHFTEPLSKLEVVKFKKTQRGTLGKFQKHIILSKRRLLL